MFKSQSCDTFDKIKKLPHHAENYFMILILDFKNTVPSVKDVCDFYSYVISLSKRRMYKKFITFEMLKYFTDSTIAEFNYLDEDGIADNLDCEEFLN